MPDSLIKKLAGMAKQVEFAEDEIVFEAGARWPHFCLLLEGSACVEIRNPYYSVTVQTLKPGDAFGWSALTSEHHTVFEVRAREASTALLLDGKKLLAACEKDCKLAAEVYRRVAETMCHRVKATEVLLADFCGTQLKRNGHHSV